jgi:hypothetical protein
MGRVGMVRNLCTGRRSDERRHVTNLHRTGSQVRGACLVLALPTGDVGEQHDTGLLAALGARSSARPMLVLQAAAAFHRVGISGFDGSA